MEEQDRLFAGKYRILAPLGSDGISEVYLARQVGVEGYEKLVALRKILPEPARDEGFVAVFFDEARAAAKLSHPNVIQIYDLGREGDDFFIATEYLEGESLGFTVSHAWKFGQFLPEALAASVILEVCKGLEYAHKLEDEDGRPLNIVHGDVCPQKIIVLFSGGVKLVDFGIAKAASRMHQTSSGLSKGKPGYMSPEQSRGGPVDARSEIFSLGIVFWELLARQRLFRRSSPEETAKAIIWGPVPRVRDAQPEIPRDLDEIAARALRKDPRTRYQTAGEMGADIGSYLRKAGVPAGTREIAAFVNKFLADRIRAKKQVLERIDGRGRSVVQAEVAGEVGEETLVHERDAKLTSDHAAAIPQKTAGPARSEAPPNLDFFKATEPSRYILLALVLLAFYGFGIAIWMWTREDEPPKKTAKTEDSRSRSFPETFPGKKKIAYSPQSEEGGRPELQPALLVVRSQPAGCAVEVDGTRISGITPVGGVSLEPKREHVVAVLCEEHQKQEKRVTGDSGERLVLSFTPESLVTSKKPELGTLNLKTRPRSVVYLGKRRLGITPLVGVKLPAGKHTLTAINKRRGLRKKIRVRIRTGRKTKLYMKLSK